MIERESVRDMRLSGGDAEVIRKWLRSELRYCADGDAALECAALRRQAARLPGTMVRAATEFGRKLGSAGVLHCRGLPLPDDVPPTPSAPDAEHSAGTETMVLAVGLLVGDLPSFGMYGFAAYGGRRLHNLYAVPEDNKERLGLHTELLNYPQRPAALAILCLRAGSGPPSPNLFCDLARVWDHLDDEDRSLLQHPQFGLAPLGEEGGDLVDLRPMVTWRRGQPRFAYTEGTRGATAAHAEVLARLTDCIAETTVEITLSPGDLVLVDNLHMLHGRQPLAPLRRDGTDRWLQRCYVHEAAA
jgi:L-asparagine oxygenase